MIDVRQATPEETETPPTCCGIGHNGGPPIEDEPEPIYVFVYGSLLQSFHNHFYLEKAKKIGETYETQDRYHMVSFGAYPAVYKAVPFDEDTTPPSELARSRSLYRPVVGEIYEVNEEQLEGLDHLESNGYFYQRELIDIVDFPHQVWMYICLRESPNSPEVALDDNRNYSWFAERQKSQLARANSN